VIGLMGVGQDITGRKPRGGNKSGCWPTPCKSAKRTDFDLRPRKSFHVRQPPFLESYGYEEAEILGKTPHFLYSPNNTRRDCAIIFFIRPGAVAGAVN